MSNHLKTYPAMRDFACLGDQCEDTCCQSWDIRFDKYHYGLLQTEIQSLPDLKATFEHYIEKIEDGDDKNYAIVRLNEKGLCPFLDARGWCQLHQKFGIAPLSNVCAFYPRVISELDGEYELAGALSCPEVARKTLFAEQSFELVSMPLSKLPRPDDFPLVRSVMTDSGDGYVACFSKVRNCFLDIVAEQQYSFEARLFGLASLANNLSAFYHQGCELLSQRQIEAELEKYQQTETMQKLQHYLEQYTAESPLAMVVVQAVLRMRTQQFPDEGLSKLITNIFADYQTMLGDTPELYGGNLPPDALWTAYQQRARALLERYPMLVEQVFSRYLENCLFREWFISMPTPFIYLHMLSIRIAMLKFLIASHPGVIELLAEPHVGRAQEAAIQAYMVEVFYRFSRAIDHNMSFLQVVYNAIAEQDMMQFDYALPFIKF